MSLLDKASLIQIPSGYKEDKLYSVVPDSGAGDFTFARSSTGTRVNSDGYIEEVPCNLLTYSEDYLSGFWSKSNTTIIANDIISPRGLQDASKIYPNSSGNYRHIRNNSFNPSSGLFTFSIYAKAGELDHLVLIDYDGSGIGVDFDLTNGVATDNATSPFDSFSMTDVGDGWYRCVATATDMYFYWILSDNGGLSVTANGTDGLFIWGAMINKGTSVKPYIKTTDRLDVPRLDYSGGASCPTLLLEPQSTNLIDNSNTISNWTLQNVTTLLNQGTSPQNTQEAILISETNNNDNHISFGSISSLSSGSQYTYSGFVKQGTQRYAFFHLVLGSVRYGIIFDFVTKSVTDVEYSGTPINESYYFTEYNDGWFRLVISMQHSGGAAYPVIGLSNSPTPTYDSNAQPIYQGNSSKNIYAWGFQLEQSSCATSYIPTSGSTVTRTADTSSTSGLSSLINSQEGVLFLEIKPLGFDTQTRAISIYDGISTNGHTNRVQIAYLGSDQISFLYRTISGNVFLQNINVTQQQNNKFALKYKENDFSAYINGVRVAEQSSGSVAAVGTFTNIATHNGNNASNFFGKCNQLILFNQALTDSELETLTTI